RRLRCRTPRSVISLCDRACRIFCKASRACRRKKWVRKFRPCRRVCKPPCKRRRCCCKPALSITSDVLSDDTRIKNARLLSRALGSVRLLASGPAAQARSDFAVDINERSELFWPRIGAGRDSLTQNENAEIGDILPYTRRQWMGWFGHRGQEDRPEFAVVKQRLMQIIFVAVPAVANRLQPRCRLQQQVGFQFAIAYRLLRYRAVSLCRVVVHIRKTSARNESTIWLPLTLCTARLLRFDY